MQYPVSAAIRAEIFADLILSLSDLDNPEALEETPLSVETLVTRLFRCEEKARLELQQFQPATEK